jgi:hypothetical protein
MNSKTKSERIDSNDPVAAILQACAHIGRTDEQSPRLDQDARLHPSDQRRRPAFRSRQRLRSTPFLGFMLLAACIYVSATAWYSYDAAKPFIAPWVPTGASISSWFPVDQWLSAKLRPDTLVAISDKGRPQPAPLTETASQEPQKAAPIPPDLAKVLEATSRDIANLQQSVEQLKTSQEQMGRDNARLNEQLRASQEQTSRDNAKVGVQRSGQEQTTLAKASEESKRPKMLRPPTTPIRKPEPTAISQARAQQLVRKPER